MPNTKYALYTVDYCRMNDINFTLLLTLWQDKSRIIPQLCFFYIQELLFKLSHLLVKMNSRAGSDRTEERSGIKMSSVYLTFPSSIGYSSIFREQLLLWVACCCLLEKGSFLHCRPVPLQWAWLDIGFRVGEILIRCLRLQGACEDYTIAWGRALSKRSCFSRALYRLAISLQSSQSRAQLMDSHRLGKGYLNILLKWASESKWVGDSNTQLYCRQTDVLRKTEHLVMCAVFDIDMNNN